jgi:hypothetical protein
VSGPRAERPEADALLQACVEMLGRVGVSELRIGYSDPDDGEPVVWYATAHFRTAGAWEAAAAMRPERAAFRLCELAMDGGTCTHCGRPTGIVDDTQASNMPANALICWYAYDPELARFRRSCEGAST